MAVLYFYQNEEEYSWLKPLVEAFPEKGPYFTKRINWTGKTYETAHDELKSELARLREEHDITDTYFGVGGSFTLKYVHDFHTKNMDANVRFALPITRSSSEEEIASLGYKETVSRWVWMF